MNIVEMKTSVIPINLGLVMQELFNKLKHVFIVISKLSCKLLNHIFKYEGVHILAK